jgi:hypothetical protein
VASTYERFWSQVDRSGGVGACWPWTGATNPDGTGVFDAGGRRTTSRRYAYRAQTGEYLDATLRVVVTCSVASCCNPRHLRIRTARAVALGNGSAAAVNGARRTCRRGHQLAPPNLYVHPNDGRRECAVCKMDR